MKLLKHLNLSLTEFFRPRNLKILVLFSLAYLALSFGTSFLGFLSPQAPFPLHQYSPSHFLEEVGGHFIFGVLAALPFLDIDLILLCGTFAVLIDSDHILEALGFYVSGRPDHSIFYAAFSFVILYYIARKMKMGNEREIKFGLLGAVVLLAHVAFDIFAAYGLFYGGGYYFPLLAPFSFSAVSFPFDYWIVLEILAFALALLGSIFGSARIRRKLLASQ